MVRPALIISRLDQAGCIVDFAHCRNTERARHNGDVRGRPAFLEYEPAQSFAVVVEERCRPHGARHDDGIFRQLLLGRRVILAHQDAHQPVGEIVKIVQTVAQIMIGSAQHARTRVGLHALDAGLGRETGHYGFADFVQPALVVREHAISFEHVTMFTAVGDVAMLDQPIQIFA